MEAELPGTDEPIDLDPTLPEQMRIAVANLMLAWGAYDSAVTYWLAKTLGTPLDVASIMYGNMQTEPKLQQIRAIFDHYGMKEAASGITQLLSAHRQRVIVRNAVAHSRCVGRPKSNLDHFAFSTVRHVKGDPGMMALTMVPYDEMLLSTRFANESHLQIMEIAGRGPQVVGPADKNE